MVNPQVTYMPIIYISIIKIEVIIMDIIEWRKIFVQDNETSYSVSSVGDIRNDISNKVLSPFEDKDGYLRATIALGPRKTYKTMVHRFVAKAFIPNPQNKPQVNHRDGNKKNNDYTNLEWATNSENMLHAFNTGLKTSRFGESSSLSHYTEEQIKLACRFMEWGIPNKMIGSRLGIDRQYLSDIRFGRRWRHISSQFKIPYTTRPERLFSIMVGSKYLEGLDAIDILNECWGESSEELISEIHKIIGYVRASETIKKAKIA
jgi:hypothetical protein